MKQFFGLLALITHFLCMQSLAMASNSEKQVIVHGYLSHISQIPMNSNVHVLDPFVCAELGNLIQIGESVGFGDACILKEQLVQNLISFIDANPTFYTGYEGQSVNNNEMKQFITTALNTASQDLNVLKCYSLAISGIEMLQNTETFRQMMLDAFAENYKTNGGCFQGVRNRMFVLYAILVNNYLLNS